MKKVRFIYIILSVLVSVNIFALTEMEMISQLQDNPVNKELRYELIKHYAKHGKLDKADEQMESLVQLEPAYSEYYFKIADLYFKNGNTEKAILSYVKVLNINPNDERAYFGMGKTFFAAGETEKAIAELKKAVKIKSTDKKTYSLLVKCYDRLGQFEAVGFYLKKIEELEKIEQEKILNAEVMERNKRKKIIWMLTGGIVITLVIFFVRKNPLIAVIFSAISAVMLFAGGQLLPGIALSVTAAAVIIYMIRIRNKATGDLQSDYKKAVEKAYRIFGLKKSANKHDIKAAYRKLAKQYHPDANRNDKQAEEKFKAITAAYDILMKEKSKD